MGPVSLTEWQSWEPFVDALRRSAPPGTDRSEFTGTIGRGTWQGTYLDDGAADARREHDREQAREAARTGGPGPRAELDDALRVLADSLETEQLVRVRTAPREEDDVVELIDLPPAVVSGPTTPVLEVVLEPGALPTQHLATITPAPGAQPAASADPDGVATVVAERMPDTPGAPLDDVAAAEVNLPAGARLPEEVRALYTAAGSGSLKLAAQCDGAFGGFEIVPLADSVLRAAFLPAARFSTWTDDAETFAPRDPAGRVQAVIGSPLWFPVGTDGAGNVYAVDLAPGPDGHMGQVVFLDHEQRAGAGYRAESLAALLVEHSSSTAAPVARQRRLDGTDQVDDVPADAGPDRHELTEFLNLDPAAWVELLDAGTVPESLKAAGLVPDRANLPALDEAISVANRLFELRGLPEIETRRVSRPEAKGLLDRILGR